MRDLTFPAAVLVKFAPDMAEALAKIAAIDEADPARYVAMADIIVIDLLARMEAAT